MPSEKLRSKTKKLKLKKEEIAPRAIVGIGASAGGLEAVTELLMNLHEKTGMAFVYVQHLDPTHKSLLTPILSRVSRMPVEEARQGTRVLADHLYIIPPNKNMQIKDGVLQLAARAGGEGRLVSIDNFFRSLAADQENRSIGIILSGNASDGVAGLEAINAGGGITFAQDEKSAKHPSMPHGAIESGAVDHVFVPADIARELGRMSHHPHIVRVRSKGQDQAGIFGEQEQDSLRKIFVMLRARSGVNFLQYKPPTLRRRISRRMVLHKIETLSEYLTYLCTAPAEVEALFQDILINVTEFFRDREVFDHLKRYVFPALMKAHSKDEPIRLWSAGCSSGEEAYSLAICLVEFLDGIKRSIPIQIFGSDLNEACIAKARTGIYSASIAKNVSPERLQRFFTKVHGHYQISKAIRDRCIFAKQNLITDPPFSQLDLITCRNVLIYLELTAQKRILPVFHYALKPAGYLILGKSEGIGEFSDLYVTKFKTSKIYTKKMTLRSRHLKTFLAEDSGTAPHYSRTEAQVNEYQQGASDPLVPESDLSKDVDQILLSQGHVAPSVVIDKEMQIVQFRGNLAPYLNFPAGKATWNLLKMARENVAMELRGAIIDAKKNQRAVLRKGAVDIEVIPLKFHTAAERHFLIVLRPGEPAADTKADAPPPEKGLRGGEKHAAHHIEKLERELSVVKEHLRSSLEEEEAAHEEFQSVNEEIVSSNEELQSTNEELETAKEELQSTNEELVTVNEELQTRNTELSQTNNDLTNVLSSVNVPIIIVDRELCIRRLTPTAEKSLRILPSDIGRPITDIKLPIRFPNLHELLLGVVETVQPMHQEVEDEEGRWYTLWVRPYMTWDNKIDGAVITLIDINDIKLLQQRNDSFMSMASHELKTPITTVKTLVQILQKRLEESEDKTLVDYLTRVAQQIEQLTTLANNLLDVSKIKANKFELDEKTFDFDSLVMEMVKNCQLLSPRHTIVVEGKTSTKIRGDRSSIGRVFINLIVNAIKYSPNAFKIIITLSRTSKDIRVGVQDFGIGIAEAHHDKIFERLFQVGNESGQNFSGLGIGLYISKTIVAEHRGRLWVESKEGSGSTFFFTLPMQKFKEKRRT